MGYGTGKHPSTDALLKFFEYSDLPQNLPQNLHAVSWKFHDLAHDLVTMLPASAEVTVGVRKLLEAKDCFVRAALP
jgi:hypothetical protein